MISIPTRTKELLEKNKLLQGFVLTSIANMNDWIKDNKTVFFPEYTDHGLTHLNEVLLTADSIIKDECWPQLTPQDAAATIISVLLHDCAMHISEDGFYTLINDQYPPINSRYIEREKTWSELWADYMAEAKRFHAKKLIEIFGDETPVRDIPPSSIDLTGRDKLLIGEFIRRHHARLAHEIAFNGVPGVNGKTLRIAEEPEQNFHDLCGFIARSHNMSLRNAVDRIETAKRQLHLNTHVPFIMLVLRIADYLQVHSERAPRRLLSVKGLVSPISKGEWKKHNAIIEINQTHTDPEALYIDAEPKDASTYDALSKLFKSIQHELDMSWSVLGETYGRWENLCELGITIRRIRSSLDDREKFIREKKPAYIPKVLKLRTADAEMIELLIAPLYGDSPRAGIRELMQNAVDACVELKDLAIKQQVKLDKNISEDVCITLYDRGDSGGELVIADRGIGMSLDVVENFFLNIGASFRNSDRWKKDHETQGRSNVYRTGRFGIGLLAAYLLGDELEVETRHINLQDNQGLKFKCKKNNDSIIIENTTREYGTTISIKLSTRTTKILSSQRESWDWFCLETPRVIRKIVTDKETILPQSRVVPMIESSLDENIWHRTESPDFDDVIWTYSKISTHYYWHRTLICNGILITDDMRTNDLHISEDLGIISVDTPSIVVFDQDGRFPINLARTGLVGTELPFKKEITRDISKTLTKEIRDYMTSLSPSSLTGLLERLNDVKTKTTLIYSRAYDGITRFLLRNKEILPLDFHLIAREEITSIFIDPAKPESNRGAWISEEFRRACSIYWAINRQENNKSNKTHWIRTYFEPNSDRSPLDPLPICGRRLLINKQSVEEIVAPGYVPKTFWNRLTIDWENEKWTMYTLGKVQPFDADLELLCTQLDGTDSLGFAAIYLDWKGFEKKPKSGENSPFSEAWLNANNGKSFLELNIEDYFSN